MAAKKSEEPAEGGPPRGGMKKKLILLGLPLVLAGIGAGLWFGGILPGMLGLHSTEQGALVRAEPMPAPRQPVFVAMPDITANLNAPGRRAFIRLKSQMEVSGAQDAAMLQAAMPRLVDLFTTYLREIRPEELRGSVGTHRLREELIARANIAAAPARITDVLFTEILVQ
ncbi:flagellar basal body-associated FliL family protein [Roseococcus sp.]|uniref:flagellar basal body-associated FliL family protein n=1 Tax=Roseococcus sp. TaxID=2109646 RepID=UPI003BA9958D